VGTAQGLINSWDGGKVGGTKKFPDSRAIGRSDFTFQSRLTRATHLLVREGLTGFLPRIAMEGWRQCCRQARRGSRNVG
jgi:hypothetical protein